MKYSLGDTLADYGFSFFEKLHSPIFLLHKSGTIKKANEAARKLLKIGHVTQEQANAFSVNLLNSELFPNQVEYISYPTSRKKIRMISKRLVASDYLLVEFLR